MRHALFTPSAARPMATSLGLGRAEARLAEALAKEKARTLPPTGFGWALLATPSINTSISSAKTISLTPTADDPALAPAVRIRQSGHRLAVQSDLRHDAQNPSDG